MSTRGWTVMLIGSSHPGRERRRHHVDEGMDGHAHRQLASEAGSDGGTVSTRGWTVMLIGSSHPRPGATAAPSRRGDGQPCSSAARIRGRERRRHSVDEGMDGHAHRQLGSEAGSDGGTISTRGWTAMLIGSSHPRPGATAARHRRGGERPCSSVTCIRGRERRRHHVDEGMDGHAYRQLGSEAGSDGGTVSTRGWTVMLIGSSDPRPGATAAPCRRGDGRSCSSAARIRGRERRRHRVDEGMDGDAHRQLASEAESDGGTTSTRR